MRMFTVGRILALAAFVWLVTVVYVIVYNNKPYSEPVKLTGHISIRVRPDIYFDVVDDLQLNKTPGAQVLQPTVSPMMAKYLAVNP